MGIKEIKRVRTLLRVSTDMQDEDMQREECSAYIAKMSSSGWVLNNEYIEPGVSAYKNSVAEREVLQRVIKDAATGSFDILLVFSSDRICRTDEYTQTMKRLSRHVEIWALYGGDLTIRTHTDALKASIDGWQNEGESLKTSARVRAKQQQMNDKGVYIGGGVPYGYKLVLSGRYAEKDIHKRKELFDKVICEVESDVVRIIYRLVLDKGFGGLQIAQHLNAANAEKPENPPYPTRGGKAWDAPTINFMLRNPHYKGYPTYGKHAQHEEIKSKRVRQAESEWNLPGEQVKELVIIPTDIWDKVHMIRAGRRPGGASEYCTTTHGKLCLVGIARCADCNSTLVSMQHKSNYIRKDGTQSDKIYYKYRCSGKKRGLPCSGQHIYAHDRIEEPVFAQVKAWLSRIETQDFTDEIEKRKLEEAKKLKAKADKLGKQAAILRKAVEELEDEIVLARKGASEFTPDRLAKIIKRKENELKVVESEIQTTEVASSLQRVEAADIKALRQALPRWDQIFEEADDRKKKMLLFSIISGIIVSADEITINLKVHIKDFLLITDGYGSMSFKSSRESA